MISEVEFHTGVPDKLAFACRLLRKAFRKGVRVTAAGPADVMAALDRELWTFEEREFVPHVRIAGRSPQALAPQMVRTPIWLVDEAPPPGAPDVLVNLGLPVPEDLAPFSRVIEVVSREPEDEASGRQRWRTYRALGLNVTHHPAAAGGA